MNHGCLSPAAVAAGAALSFGFGFCTQFMARLPSGFRVTLVSLTVGGADLRKLVAVDLAGAGVASGCVASGASAAFALTAAPSATRPSRNRFFIVVPEKRYGPYSRNGVKK